MHRAAAGDLDQSRALLRIQAPGERDPLVDLVDPGVAAGFAVGAVAGVDLGVTQL